MNTMKEHKYKVEVFIIPGINKQQLDTSTNEIDDLKVANITKLKKAVECSENITHDRISGINDREADENLRNKINSALLRNNQADVKSKETSNDTPIIETTDFYETHEENILHKLIQECVLKKTQVLQQRGSCDVTKLEINKQKASTMCNTLLPKKPIRKFNSLISIDEQSEDSEGNFSDFCQHGYKNGCTASVPTPEEVSGKVFQANWLEKLESLRQKEALLKQKEVSLQERERSLFKREKDLRILERSVKEKMKKAELCLKRCKVWQDNGNGLKEFSDTDQKELNLQSLDDNREHAKIKDGAGVKHTNIKESLTNKNATKTKYHSRNSLNSHAHARNHFGRHSAYSSLPTRSRPKISYDDLNSTLSADIGDASFVLTSQKLDPELVKRPTAFGKSSHECYEQKGSSACGLQHNFISTEEKILKRISDNIIVSQDEETRFQNYGLIDQDVFSTAYSGQHKSEKMNSKEEDTFVRQKSRPASWNGEAEEWLQKKRHAYNLKVSADFPENKENITQSTKSVKMNKSSKKKDSNKNKILSIFR